MSQYPTSYPPMQGPPMYPGHNPYASLLAPARKAGLTMYVLGGLALLFGACTGLMSLMFSSMGSMPETQAQYHQIEEQMQANFPGISPQFVLGFTGIFMLVAAVLLIVVGFFVRRGGRGAAIAGLWVVIPGTLYMGLNLLAAGMKGGAQAAAGIIVSAIPLALCAMLLRWLIQAIQNASQIQYAQSQYQAQYTQYQQQAMTYGQGQMPPPPQGAYAPQPGYGAPAGGGYGGGYGAPPQAGFVPGLGGQWQQPNWPLQQPPPPPQTPHQPNPPAGPAA